MNIIKCNRNILTCVFLSNSLWYPIYIYIYICVCVCLCVMMHNFRVIMIIFLLYSLASTFFVLIFLIYWVFFSRIFHLYVLNLFFFNCLFLLLCNKNYIIKRFCGKKIKKNKNGRISMKMIISYHLQISLTFLLTSSRNSHFRRKTK